MGKRKKLFVSVLLVVALNKGITTGTTATTFSPNSTCTGTQIVTFLYRFLG